MSEAPMNVDAAMISSEMFSRWGCAIYQCLAYIVDLILIGRY